MGAGAPGSAEARTHRVVVEIYGEQYALRGEAEPAYIQDLAARLDARMRDLGKRRARLSPTQVAVLTALNTLDELVRLEGQYHRVLALFEREWERRKAEATRELARDTARDTAREAAREAAATRPPASGGAPPDG